VELSTTAGVIRTVLDVALILAAAIALGLGYVVHRWIVLAVAVCAGVVIIVVDVTTRNLVSAGHDDRGRVAMTEAVLLLGAAAFFALGALLRGMHEKRRARDPAESDGRHHLPL